MAGMAQESEPPAPSRARRLAGFASMAFLGALTASTTAAVVTQAPRRFHVPLLRALSEGEGFYPYDRVCIWSKKEARFSLSGMDRGYASVCHLGVMTHCPDPNLLPTVQFSVDGVRQSVISLSNQAVDVSLTLPPREGAPGAQIDLRCSKTFVPGGGDTRELGAVISSIDIETHSAGLGDTPRRALLGALLGGLLIGGCLAAGVGSTRVKAVSVIFLSALASIVTAIACSPLDDPVLGALVVSATVLLVQACVRWVVEALGRPSKRLLVLEFSIAVSLYAGALVVCSRIGIGGTSEVIEDYWQVMDPKLLRTDLLRSLYYMHSQPPLFNVQMAIFEKCFLTRERLARGICGLLYGIAVGVLLLSVLRDLKVPPWARAPMVTAFMVSPPFLIHARLFDYTLLVVTLHALWMCALARYGRTRHLGWLALCFASVAVLALTRSLYHLVWVIVLALTVLAVRHRQSRAVAALGLGSIAVVAAWYLKNLLLFGMFTASSWQGMNMERVIVWWINSDPKFVRLVASGKLSPFLSIGPFQDLSQYAGYVSSPAKTGIPILDERLKTTGAINFHNLAYVPVSRKYAQEIGRLIRVAPDLYLRGCGFAFFHFFQPGSDAPPLSPWRAALGGYADFWDRYVYARLRLWVTRFASIPSATLQIMMNDGAAILAAFAVCLGSGLVCLTRLLRLRQRCSDVDLLLFLVTMTLVYVVAVGSLFERKENMRFRFEVEPLMLVGVSACFRRGPDAHPPRTDVH